MGDEEPVRLRVEQLEVRQMGVTQHGHGCPCLMYEALLEAGHILRYHFPVDAFQAGANGFTIVFDVPRVHDIAVDVSLVV